MSSPGWRPEIGTAIEPSETSWKRSLVVQVPAIAFRPFALFGSLLVAVALVSPHWASAREADGARKIAVAPQYGTTHVYVAPDDVDRFAASFLATFGGRSTPQSVATVTPTPGSTTTQLLQTPAGTVSLFGFRTPIPYPFGSERTGYLVTDMTRALRAARAAGADVLVAPFSDPLGMDAVIQWPGGVNTQLYWHTKAPAYAPLATVPENRVYVSPDRVAAFVRSFVRFSGGKVIADDAKAPGVEIGRPGETYRRIRIESDFGTTRVMVTDGHLPFPYGREVTGYEVSDLADTLARATGSGCLVLVGPFAAGGRKAAMLQFPGGYIAEVHAPEDR